VYVVWQVLHFCYGLGAFVSPMIAEPFLLHYDSSLFVDNDTSSYGAELASASAAAAGAGPHQRSAADLAHLDLNATVNLLPAKSLAEAQQMTRVRFAFWIMAALMVRSLRRTRVGGALRFTSIRNNKRWS